MGGLGLMTAIKVKTCTSKKHLDSLGRYLSPEREKVLAHGSQFISSERDWKDEFMRTLRAYGFDRPSRANASVAYARHVVIAFNPDECQPGGKVTPEFASSYTRELIERRWPNVEAAWVIHREVSEDGVSRLAAHIALGNVDLERQRRLNEGIGRKAAIEHAKLVRELDEEHGLRQLVAGERNCLCHAIQPTIEERHMIERGAVPEKAYIRAGIRAHIKAMASERFRGNGMRELARRLEAKHGIRMTLSSGRKRISFEHNGFRVGGSRLGRGFSISGLEKALSQHLEREISREQEFELER